MYIHYAIQTCDSANREEYKRYAGENKTEVTQKCILSFFLSLKKLASEHPETINIVEIFDDNSSEKTIIFLKKIIQNFSADNLKIHLTELEERGVMNSIQQCYNWMEREGVDLVYQIQDDFLFYEHTIFESIFVFLKMFNEVGISPIINPYSFPYIWDDYRFFRTMVINGFSEKWIAMHHLACTFLTSKKQFSRHWDIYEQFFNLDPKGEKMEEETLNRILRERDVIGLIPMNTLAFHLQSEKHKDLYKDPLSLWNSIDIKIYL